MPARVTFQRLLRDGSGDGEEKRLIAMSIRRSRALANLQARRRDRIRVMPRASSPMDDLTRAVLEHVDPRELVDVASALIRIASFKTEETPVSLFLQEFFRQRGYDVDLQEIELRHADPGSGGRSVIDWMRMPFVPPTCTAPRPGRDRADGAPLRLETAGSRLVPEFLSLGCQV